jgi:hypothetical protein
MGALATIVSDTLSITECPPVLTIRGLNSAEGISPVEGARQAMINIKDEIGRRRS